MSASGRHHLVTVALLAAAGLIAASPARGQLDLCGAASDDSVRALLDVGRHKEVEMAARACLETREGAAATLVRARALDRLVSALLNDARYDSSVVALAEEAIAIREQIQGPDAGDLWKSLANRSFLSQSRGDYEGARAGYDRALTVVERAYGQDDVRVAKILQSVGFLRRRQGDYPGSKEAYARALAINEAANGPNTVEAAQNLAGLGTVAQLTGDLVDAKDKLERALAIRERASGPTHPGLAAILTNLAAVTQLMGNYTESAASLERAAEILEATYGPDHPRLAPTLTNLGAARMHLGDYVAARRAIARAITILETRLGPDHVDLGPARGVLGQLLLETGDYAEAERSVARVVASFEKTFGAGNIKTVEAQVVLAGIYLHAGRFADARAVLERSLDAAEKSLGREHYMTMTAASSLGEAYHGMGNTAGAREMALRALAAAEAVAGPDHPMAAEHLLSLAELDREAGDLETARKRLEAALEIFETGAGPAHPAVGIAAVRLARVLADLGESGEAFALALRGESIGRDQLRATCRGFSEREALRYAAERTVGLDLALDLAVRRGDAASSALAWDAAIRSRACVLDEIVARNSAAQRALRIAGDASRANPESAASAAGTMAEYAEACERVASLTTQGVGQLPPETYRALLDEARSAAENAERALSERSEGFRQARREERAGLDEVLGSLPRNAALVSYARYEMGEGSRYVAFVARASANPSAARRAAGEIALVPLGDAAAIDANVARWRAEIVRPAAGRGDLTTMEASCRAAGAAVREAVWDPIASAVSGADLILVVPDGALNLVSFAALPAAGAEYFASAVAPTQILSAERDVVALDSPLAHGGGLLALGSPDFDAPPSDVTIAAIGGAGGMRLRGITPAAGVAGSEADEESITENSAPFRGALAECPDLATHRFEALPGTASEAKEIAKLWDSSTGSRGGRRERGGRGAADSSEIATEDEATEGLFKAGAPGHRILHVATHGFFLGEGCPAAGERQRGVGKISPRPGVADVAPPAPPASGDNPLRLSGLALAGANRRADARPGDEDGILTAEEIGALDLSSVEWAVLSACETGLGDVRAGEGVFGLRRAFRAAGARTLISSLWSVEDAATRDWMRALYEARLSRGLGTARATQAACRSVLERRRAARQSTHPFYWAPFVAAGDWR